MLLADLAICFKEWYRFDDLRKGSAQLAPKLKILSNRKRAWLGNCGMLHTVGVYRPYVCCLAELRCNHGIDFC